MMKTWKNFGGKLRLAMMLCIVMAIFVVTAMAADLTITDDNGTGGYAYADGVHTISKAGEYTVSGTYNGDDYINVDVTEDESVVLNLDNVNMTTTAQYAIRSEWYGGPLTINIIGDNYFEATGSGQPLAFRLAGSSAVALQGTSSNNSFLTLKSAYIGLFASDVNVDISNLTLDACGDTEAGISSSADMTFNNCVVYAESSNGKYGLQAGNWTLHKDANDINASDVVEYSVYILNSQITAQGNEIGLNAQGAIHISDSTISAKGQSYVGLYSVTHIRIDNSVIDAYCDEEAGINAYYAVSIYNSDITANGGLYGISTAEHTLASPVFVKGIVIDGGKINATGGSALSAGECYFLTNAEVTDTSSGKSVTGDYNSYTALAIVGGSSTYENAGYTPSATVVEEAEAVETTEVTESQIAKSTSSTVLVNGVESAFEAYNINNNNYFKLRDLAMAVSGTEKQFEVIWDGDLNAINLVSGQAYTAVSGELAIGDGTAKNYTVTSSAVYVDGVEASFEAYNINDNNYFKLRDVCRIFDIGVTWDEATQTIGIDTGISYAD